MPTPGHGDPDAGSASAIEARALRLQVRALKAELASLTKSSAAAASDINTPPPADRTTQEPDRGGSGGADHGDDGGAGADAGRHGMLQELFLALTVANVVFHPFANAAFDDLLGIRRIHAAAEGAGAATT